MQSQNYSNHRRWVPPYHFLALLGSLILLIGTIVNLVKSSSDNLYDASLLVFGSLILLVTTFYTRGFALKVQDRAIRAEENFRHYILTGKMLNTKLTMRQIIGLRFASDEEFTTLAQKAIEENLSENAIKKSIQNWRADMDRA